MLLIDLLRTLQIAQGSCLSTGYTIPQDREMRITDLLYKADLNVSTIYRVLESAKEKGLVETRKDRMSNFFKLTKKGYETVTSFNEWDVDHNITPLSIYTISRSEGKSIILQRNIDNLKIKKT